MKIASFAANGDLHLGMIEGDQVIGKQWSDPDRAIEGSNPHVGQPGDVNRTRVNKIDQP